MEKRLLQVIDYKTESGMQEACPRDGVFCTDLVHRQVLDRTVIFP